VFVFAPDIEMPASTRSPSPEFPRVMVCVADVVPSVAEKVSEDELSVAAGASADPVTGKDCAGKPQMGQLREPTWRVIVAL